MGCLSRIELKDGLERYYLGKPIQDRDLDSIFKAIDTNQSGYIEFTEFIVACQDRETMM